MNLVHANLVSILVAAVAAWVFGALLHRPEQALDGSAGQNPGAAEQDAKSTLAKGAPFVVVFISEIIIGWALYGILCT